MTDQPIKVIFSAEDSGKVESLKAALQINTAAASQPLAHEHLAAALEGEVDFVVFSKEQAKHLLQQRDALAAQLKTAQAEVETRLQERTTELAQAIEVLREQVSETQVMEHDIRRQNRELAILNSIPTAISSSLDIAEVLLVLKSQLSHHLGVPGGCLFTYEEASDEFRLQEDWGIPEEVIRTVKIFQARFFPAHEIIVSRKPYLFANVKENRLWIRFKMEQARPDWQSCLCVPLLADGRMQGAAVLFSTEKFDEAQIAFFATFGRQVGVAFHHARLFEQVYTAHERTRVLSQRLVEIQEEERRNIARELHDEIGQILTGLKLILEMSQRLPPEESKANVQEAQNLVGELMSKVRQISLDLRPGMLDDLGLLPALLWYLERYTAQTQVHVNFSHNGLELCRFNSQLETAAYRIVQEALTNVARHAGVAEVEVAVWADPDILYVRVEDAGKGFDADAALAANNSSGVAGMGERARLLGGGLTIESAVGVGTRITANLPLWNELD